MWVFVWSSKVDQAGCGFEIFVEPMPAHWCAVLLTSSAILSICKRMVDTVGLDAVVSSHLLHISGASAAMITGLGQVQIMAIGGWQSDAVDCYLRAF
jgi:hypothetical protein